MLIFFTLIDDEGDIHKFEQLYHLYRQYMFAVCNSILHDSHSAEDAVQDSLLYIAKNMKKIKDIESRETKNLVQIISRCRAIDIYRKNQKHNHLNLDEIGTYFTSDDSIDLSLIQNERIREIADAILSLPVIYSRALELLIYYGLSQHDIAELSGVSYSTIKSRIKTGRKMLAQELHRRGITVEE